MTAPAATPEHDEFAKLLAWSYRGELGGEVMFKALLGAWPGEGHDAEMRELAELELRMGRAVAGLLAAHSVSGGDDERTRRGGREQAAAIAGRPWEDFLGQFGLATKVALERYHRLRSLAPESDHPVIDTMIAHEEALQGYAAARLRGEEASALGPVRDVLLRLAG